MSFISTKFIYFLVLFSFAFFFTPKNYKKYLILIASYFFYASWNPLYLGLIIFTSCLDFVVANKIQQNYSEEFGDNYLKISTNSETRTSTSKRLLLISLISNLSILMIFKYFNFFSSSFNQLLLNSGLESLKLPLVNLLLPVGISFYTFQSLSYVIDIYRCKMPAEQNLINYCAYVAFFPQLVAGPIERASNLLPQFKNIQTIKYSNLQIGLRTSLYGFFKKIVIADYLAIYVNDTYNHYQELSGLSLLIATYLFAFQIYCDFSGYSDIAIGTAKIFGFDLMLNFKKPYFANNINDFWRRWHISLSTWFRDYIYFPLGGNRSQLTATMRNILTVFIISGLWHGANWTYVFWGALHGLALVIYRLKPNNPLNKYNWMQLINNLMTFNFISFTWLFFRAQDLDTAFHILNKILFEFCGTIHTLEFRKFDLGFALISLFIFLFYEYFSRQETFHENISKLNKLSRNLIYALMLIWIFININPHPSSFIYFQF